MPQDLTERLITRHVALAMGAAALPMPLVDVAAVTWVQVDLVERLAQRYGVEGDRTRAKAAVLALAGAAAARLGGSLVKAVPGGGWIVGGATQLALAGATTYALGQVYREHFEAEGTLTGPDFESLRERYEAYVERGRELARTLRDQVSFDDEIDPQVEAEERLARLRRAGILTEDEYRRLTEALPEAPEPPGSSEA
jgi:uncharacterized protein (DUF697 family)